MYNVGSNRAARDGEVHSLQQSGGAKDVLETGYEHFDNQQYRDAKECFSKALEIDEDNHEARLALNLVIQSVVPRWHFGMLNDRERNDSYDAAITKAIDESKTVLDVGSGSGLLAMMAARAGASMTYSCEMNETLAKVAEFIVANNGYGERVKVINKKSDKLVLGHDLDTRVDVLITETLDSGLLGEGVIPIVMDAKERLLVEGGQIIPRGAKVYAALIETRDVWELNNVDLASGFDVSCFNGLATAGAYPIRLARFPHRFLSEPVEVCEFDFMLDELQPRTFVIPLVTRDQGECHGVAYWFDLFLDEKTSFRNSPENENSHWKQAVQCFARPLAVGAKQEYVLSVSQTLTGFGFDLVPRA